MSAACPDCGRTWVIPSQACRCGHGETTHDIGARGARTACLHYNAKGRCPCEAFTAAEVPRDGS